MFYRSLLLSLLFCTSCHLFAQKTLYVATNGNDNNNGTTLATPLRTIPRAIELAEPNDIIELRNGTYTSQEIRITKNNLTIRSRAGEWAIIQAVTNIEDVSSCLWYSNPDVVGGTLERLEIIGGYYYGIKFETNWDYGLPMNERHGVSNITVKNCKIHDTGRDCIKLTSLCNNIQILDCEIYNSGKGIGNDPQNPNAEGIDNVHGNGMIVRNCYFHDISTTGVYFKGSAANCLIENCYVANTGEAGILLGFYTDSDFFDPATNPKYFECINSTARNNIVVNTGGTGIGFWGAKNCKAYNNTVVTASPKFHAPLMFSKGEIYVGETEHIDPVNEDVTVLNNIFVDLSPAGDDNFTAQMREGSVTGKININNNIYQKKSGAAIFTDGVSFPYLNFSQWQSTLRLDSASREIDPLLNTQQHLQANSPAIDKGKNIAGVSDLYDYDCGKRTGTPDIGADEINVGVALNVPPQNGTIGTGCMLVSDIFEVNELKSNVATVQISPNPADANLSVFIQTFSPSLANFQLDILDITGKNIRPINMPIRLNEAMNINCSTWQRGIYFLRLSTNEGMTTKKVVLF